MTTTASRSSALGLVGGADQHAGQIGQPGGHGAGLLDMRSDDGDIVRLE